MAVQQGIEDVRVGDPVVELVGREVECISMQPNGLQMASVAAVLRESGCQVEIAGQNPKALGCAFNTGSAGCNAPSLSEEAAVSFSPNSPASRLG